MNNSGDHAKQPVPATARPWLIAGSITGTITIALLTALIGYAVHHNPPVTVATMVVGIIDLLLGMASIKLLCDASTMVTIHRTTSRYVEGVGDTVDRLASVLPQPDNVRRLG
ncbi:hypothetical protein [Micromonospora sp. C41]|uniref:hypothetical protein n=1 Tax=Micromonospora sp. C41 TaxID=2824878 RepID=UPI001B37E681|nr:hypothetical protein [Micromonospora sp. C41]MBQ1064444.1 hypothetical protein [Micromonospora sp. C41]